MKLALIIDDNQDIRSLIKQALEMENFEIVQAENGAIAQAKLTAGVKPSVILLDLMMPVMSGQEFLVWKNTQPSVSQIPVIVISALANTTELPGTVRYLRKPLDLKSVLDTVEQICS